MLWVIDLLLRAHVDVVEDVIANVVQEMTCNRKRACLLVELPHQDGDVGIEELLERSEGVFLHPLLRFLLL